MPKEITHFKLAEIFSEHIIGKKNFFSSWIENLLRDNMNAFYLGSVGPDILYYDISLFTDQKFLPRGTLWSDALHGAHGEKTLLPIREMLREIQKNKNGEHYTTLTQNEKLVLAFILGYLCHVAVDISLHPSIYYYSGLANGTDINQNKQAETGHRMLETLLDLYILKLRDSSLDQNKFASKIKLNKSQYEKIWFSFSDGLRKAYGNNLIPETSAGLIDSIKINSENQRATNHMVKTLKRSFMKQKIVNRIMSMTFLKKLFGVLNYVTGGLLDPYQSLIYPSKTYDIYMKKKNPIDIHILLKYRNPINNQEITKTEKSYFRGMYKKTIQFWQAAYEITEKKTLISEYSLPDYSLNHGLIEKGDRAMQYFHRSN